MNLKSILSWNSFILFTLAIVLPRSVSAQTNYYWQTIAQSVAASGGPQGVGVDSSGDVFAANTFDDTIIKATPTGTNWTIATIAGSSGLSGTNDGVGAIAEFNNPFSLAVENSSTLFVMDSLNNAVREVHFDGANWNVTTVAGISGADANDGTTDGDGTNQFAQFNQPNGIAVDSQGDLYVADTGDETIRQIRHSGTNWITTTIAGAVGVFGANDGTNGDAQFEFPYDVAVNSKGDLFVADYFNDAIREIIPIGTNWVTTTIAGQDGTQAFSDGTNISAAFNEPNSIAVDSFNNVYVADTYNNAIRKLVPVGTNWVTFTIGGLSQGGGPSNPGLLDGTNAVAQFTTPQGIAVDLGGNVYVGDTVNNALRVGYIFPPAISFALTGNLATLSYPASLGTNFGFVLQATTNLNNPVWLDVTNKWLLTTSAIPYNVLGVTNKVPNRFFRLQLP
jgi:sugar lactone lactonase YvrE